MGPDDRRLHFRILNVSASGVPATIVASAPRDAVLGPLWEAMRTLALSLAVLGIALIGAMLIQVRLGLRPLERLRRAVADVRSGLRERVPDAQPSEVQPLATELNALLVQNAANLDRARKHVSNLAHGLKTPLATLAIALQKQTPGSDDLHDLVVLMDRRIRHHLGRARSAALGGPVRTRTAVASRVADLALVLGKVNADKATTFVNTIPPGLSVACEQQDIDEMLGNVLENAFSWCRSKVLVRSSEDGRSAVIVVEDDGPGLSPEQMSAATQAGRRLDESSPGFGFGLSITRELAELYAGSLALDRSSLGGLQVAIRLPSAGID
ncbi:sensor histidine kinase [Bradyrhizobium sp. 41S5]|uniref:sensor histidine kinase n=1 Tax=Bradyrhizobium sp. 41S5 TaxID=1404443 RepID=UPI001E2EFB38|nr:sensor histidine kinase [Bradyrhizobium sp. 41S5]UFX46249.1 sensor histidine kinase [Bradyrhizobium sp. 41S5]